MHAPLSTSQPAYFKKRNRKPPSPPGKHPSHCISTTFYALSTPRTWFQIGEGMPKATPRARTSPESYSHSLPPPPTRGAVLEPQHKSPINSHAFLCIQSLKGATSSSDSFSPSLHSTHLHPPLALISQQQPGPNTTMAEYLSLRKTPAQWKRSKDMETAM